MERTTNQEDLSLFQTFEERHSVRQYETGIEIPRENLNEMLEAATLAPSSWNLQHWRFLVIDDQEKKEMLLPITYNQKQIVDSSATVVILGDLEANKEAEGIYSAAVENGYMPQNVKETLVNQINQAYSSGTTFPRDEAILNSSLAAMQLMLAAKAKGYDTCPIGGFDREKFVKAFNVPKRFTPVMLLAIGKAATPAHPSARKPLEEMTTYNSF